MSETWEGGEVTPPPLPTEPPSIEPTPTKRKRTSLLIGGLVIVGAIIAAVLVLSGGSDENVIHGTYQLFDSDSSPNIAGSPTECHGTGGYSDISAGMPLKITNSDGKIIGSGSASNFEDEESLLSAVNATGDSDKITSDDLDELGRHACILSFEIKVPKSDFYVVTAKDLRGDVTYSYDEMSKKGFRITVTVGD